MNKEDVIDLILKATTINDYNKKDLVKVIADAPEQPLVSFQVEKYKIDRLIDEGLMKQIVTPVPPTYFDRGVTLLGNRQFVLLCLINSVLFWFWVIYK